MILSFDSETSIFNVSPFQEKEDKMRSRIVRMRDTNMSILWQMVHRRMHSLSARVVSNSFLYFQGLSEYLIMVETD